METQPQPPVLTGAVKRSGPMFLLPPLKAFRNVEFDAEVHEGSDTFLVHMHLRQVEGRYLLHRYSVESLDDTVPIRTDWKPPLGELARMGLFEYGFEQDQEVLDVVNGADGDELRELGIDDEGALSTIALLYYFALGTGRRPADYIAQRLGWSLSATGRWIQASKDKGVLKVSSTRRRLT